MANDSDQITVKVHNFVPQYLTDMLDFFEKEGLRFSSELALHDVAVLRLKDQYDEAIKTKEGFKTFMESMINDCLYLQENEIVKVKMRGIKSGSVEKKK
jgi:arginine deiminase